MPVSPASVSPVSQPSHAVAPAAAAPGRPPSAEPLDEVRLGSQGLDPDLVRMRQLRATGWAPSRAAEPHRNLEPSRAPEPPRTPESPRASQGTPQLEQQARERLSRADWHGLSGSAHSLLSRSLQGDAEAASALDRLLQDMPAERKQLRKDLGASLLRRLQQGQPVPDRLAHLALEQGDERQRAGLLDRLSRSGDSTARQRASEVLQRRAQAGPPYDLKALEELQRLGDGEALGSLARGWKAEDPRRVVLRGRLREQLEQGQGIPAALASLALEGSLSPQARDRALASVRGNRQANERLIADLEKRAHDGRAASALARLSFTDPEAAQRASSALQKMLGGLEATDREAVVRDLAREFEQGHGDARTHGNLAHEVLGPGSGLKAREHALGLLQERVDRGEEQALEAVRRQLGEEKLRRRALEVLDRAGSWERDPLRAQDLDSVRTLWGRDDLTPAERGFTARLLARSARTSQGPEQEALRALLRAGVGRYPEAVDGLLAGGPLRTADRVALARNLDLRAAGLLREGPLGPEVRQALAPRVQAGELQALGLLKSHLSELDGVDVGGLERALQTGRPAAFEAGEMLKKLYRGPHGPSRDQAARVLLGMEYRPGGITREELLDTAVHSTDPSLRQAALRQVPGSPVGEGPRQAFRQSLARRMREHLQRTSYWRASDRQADPVVQLNQVLWALEKSREPEFVGKIDLEKANKRLGELLEHPEVTALRDQAVFDAYHGQADRMQADYLLSQDFSRRLQLLPPGEREPFLAGELGKLQELNPLQAREVAESLRESLPGAGIALEAEAPEASSSLLNPRQAMDRGKQASDLVERLHNPLPARPPASMLERITRPAPRISPGGALVSAGGAVLDGLQAIESFEADDVGAGVGQVLSAVAGGVGIFFPILGLAGAVVGKAVELITGDSGEVRMLKSLGLYTG